MFSRFYDFTMFDEAYADVSFGTHVKIGYSHGFRYANNGFNFIDHKKSILAKTRGSVLVCGEVTTHDLNFVCLFRRKTIFYTEFFFKPEESWARKLGFYAFFLPFRGRPFMVPTRKSYRTLSRISRRVFYLPPLYHGRTGISARLGDKQLRLTIVGYVDDWKKNHRTLFSALNELSAEGIDLHLDIVGGFRGSDRSVLEMIAFPHTVHGQVGHEEVKRILHNANLHVQPSYIDPIGFAGVEAMAQGLPIVVSLNCGCADFVDGNGIIIDPYRQADLKAAIASYVEPRKRVAAGRRSRRLVEERYWTGNRKLISSYHGKLERFIEQAGMAS